MKERSCGSGMEDGWKGDGVSVVAWKAGLLFTYSLSQWSVQSLDIVTEYGLLSVCQGKR